MASNLPVAIVILIAIFLVAILIMFWMSGNILGSSGTKEEQIKFQRSCMQWNQNGCKEESATGELETECKDLYGSVANCVRVCLNSCNAYGGE